MTGARIEDHLTLYRYRFSPRHHHRDHSMSLQPAPTFGLDHISLTEEQAATLMAHHIHMAMRLFEIVPEEGSLMRSKLEEFIRDPEERQIALRFTDDLQNYFDALSITQGD